MVRTSTSPTIGNPTSWRKAELTAISASTARNTRIPGLDALRAVAILLVLIYHFAPSFVSYSAQTGLGPFGVMIFFVLSGYLITSLLVREFAAAGDISFRTFYRNRALRLLPVFYICWLASSALIVHFGKHLSGWEWFSSAFYLMDYARAFSVDPAGFHNIGVAWSLAIEEQFYLLWPVALLFILRRRWNPGGCIAAAIALVWMYRTALVGLHLASANYVYNAFETRVDAILIGCWLAFFRGRKPSRVEAAAAVGIIVLNLSCSAWIGADAWRVAASYICQPVLVAVVMLYLVRSKATRLLDNRLVAFVAAISYSLYLVHGVVLDYRLQLGHQRWPVILTLLASIALLYGVEKPIAQLRRNPAVARS